MLKAKELRDQSTEELELMLQDCMHQLYVFKNSALLEKPDQPHKAKEFRRHIARLQTVINEKKRV